MFSAAAGNPVTAALGVWTLVGKNTRFEGSSTGALGEHFACYPASGCRFLHAAQGQSDRKYP
ncbi:MAG TPA: hypothetical protein VFU31_22870, partial [Candidatus Binatia bacterium]|nr:hypothetical protein [Candidatus Binatia bacterium]